MLPSRAAPPMGQCQVIAAMTASYVMFAFIAILHMLDILGTRRVARVRLPCRVASRGGAKPTLFGIRRAGIAHGDHD